MAEPLDDPEIVVSDVGILRRISDEAFIGETSAEMVVELIVDLGVRYICRPAFQAVLADYNRATLARLHIFGHEQYPVRKHFRPYIKHHLIPFKLWLVQNQPCPTIRRQAWRR